MNARTRTLDAVTLVFKNLKMDRALTDAENKAVQFIRNKSVSETKMATNTLLKASVLSKSSEKVWPMNKTNGF